LVSAALLCAHAQAQLFDPATRGETVERQLPGDRIFTPWVHDPQLLESESGDQFEMREVASEELETVKLTNLVAPIHFDSGVVVPVLADYRMKRCAERSSGSGISWPD
jgi:hypothetical protein